MPDETPRRMTPDEVKALAELRAKLDAFFVSEADGVVLTEHEAALIARLIATVGAPWEMERALQEDASRYRFLKPHLTIDGDVDDPDFATRHWRVLTIDLALPDGWDTGDVDAAIDEARLGKGGEETGLSPSTSQTGGENG